MGQTIGWVPALHGFHEPVGSLAFNVLDAIGPDRFVVAGVIEIPTKTVLALSFLVFWGSPIVSWSWSKSILPLDGKSLHRPGASSLVASNTVQTLEGLYLGAGVRRTFIPDAPSVAVGTATFILTGNGGSTDTPRTSFDVIPASSEGI